MDSTRTRTATQTAPSGNGDDLIGGLDDDVLLHVLRFLPTARDVVRTSALSRRWRHLWRRAPALRFASGVDASPEDGLRFNAIACAVLARRAADGGARVDALEISTASWPGRARVDAWLRLAMGHVAGSLSLLVAPPARREKAGVGDALLGELPSRTGAAAMKLSLGHATLPFPATAAFRELAELSLTSVAFVHGQGDRLGELLSSPCCPRLRRLSLEFLSGLTELRLEAGALEFLELALLLELRWLQVDAGGLGSLCIKGCFVAPENRAGTAATIRAPALRELSFFSTSGPELLELDGWSSVTRLEKIGVSSHLLLTSDDDAGENDFAIELLRRSTSVRRHHVCLKIPQRALVFGQDMMADIPQLPHVTDLIVEVSSPGNHSFGASVTNILTRCTNLRRLRIDVLEMELMPRPPCLSKSCVCDHPAGWADERLALPHLREAEFRGFAGCRRLAPPLLAGAPGLERMTVTASRRELSSLRRRLPPWKTADRVLESRLPTCSRGRWAAIAGRSADAPAYQWTPDHVQDTTSYITS